MLSHRLGLLDCPFLTQDSILPSMSFPGIVLWWLPCTWNSSCLQTQVLYLWLVGRHSAVPGLGCGSHAGHYCLASWNIQDLWTRSLCISRISCDDLFLASVWTTRCPLLTWPPSRLWPSCLLSPSVPRILVILSHFSLASFCLAWFPEGKSYMQCKLNLRTWWKYVIDFRSKIM